ncbi:MAG: ArsI/CadI family heavy metal resistance metalloenzyme [Burkholderiales bacterium]
MKRFHVHVAVDDLAANIRFYSTVFAAPPTVVKDDYAKWMIEDPRVNFAISARGMKPGVDHLGFQVDTDEELAGLRKRVGDAKIAARDQARAACCYASSNKYWTTDPQGIAWETFHTLGEIPVFGSDAKTSESELAEGSACCAPRPKAINATPPPAKACC